MNNYCERVIEEVKGKYSNEPEYIQAVEEVLNSLSVVFDRHPEYESLKVLENLVYADRIIEFKVPLTRDDGSLEYYRGYRIQHSNLLGVYKGGLRFHPSVCPSILKFLAFEQTFKNSLTTLPMGGGKGGSNFNPKGKSDAEIERFCYSFMKELSKYIGEGLDVPAGDLGVGGREIKYLFKAYKDIKKNDEMGFITGKPLDMGGSLARTEATGYGLVYFVEEVLKRKPIENPRVVVSGSGNVAIYAAKKCQQLGFKVVGMSDSNGYILDEDLDVEEVRRLKEDQNKASLSNYSKGTYKEGSIYDEDLHVDIVLPCATQNEINKERAERLVKNGVKIVAEGANMPDNNDAIAVYKANGVVFVPGKASNAGGVATSFLEMDQNWLREKWTFEEVDNKLKNIMKAIHESCIKAIDEYDLDKYDYVSGANIAGATKVINAYLAKLGR